MGSFCVNHKELIQLSDEELKDLQKAMSLADDRGKSGFWLAISSPEKSMHEWVPLSASITMIFDAEVVSPHQHVSVIGEPD